MIKRHERDNFNITKNKTSGITELKALINYNKTDTEGPMYHVPKLTECNQCTIMNHGGKNLKINTHNHIP